MYRLWIIRRDPLLHKKFKNLRKAVTKPIRSTKLNFYKKDLMDNCRNPEKI